MTAEELKIVVTAQTASAKKNLKDIKNETSSLGKQVTAAGKAFRDVFGSAGAIGLAILATRKLSQGFTNLENEYFAAAREQTKLAAALKATNYVVGLSIQQMADYAMQLSKLTGIDNNAIIGAESLAVTFTKIGRDIFPQAIQRAADMANMFGGDLQQSMLQLGTALNDPIAGVGRLLRIGVSFTQQQRDQIKAFMDQNDIMSAQKVILDELKNEFGGVAEAIGNTDEGIKNKLSVSMGNLRKEIGKSLTESARPFREWLINITDNLITAKQKLDGFISSYRIASQLTPGNISPTDQMSQIDQQIAALQARMQSDTSFGGRLRNIFLGGLMSADLFNASNRATGEQMSKQGLLTDAQIKKSLQDQIDALNLMKYHLQEAANTQDQQRKDAENAAAAEAAAAAQAAADMTALNDQYAKTKEGQIEALQSVIDYFNTGWIQGKKWQAVMQMLNEQMAALKGTADTALGLASAFYLRPPEGIGNPGITWGGGLQNPDTIIGPWSGMIGAGLNPMQGPSGTGYLPTTTAPLPFMGGGIGKTIEDLKKYNAEMEKALKDSLKATAINAATNAFLSLGEAIGKGGDALKNFGQALAGMIGDLAKQVGLIIMRKGAESGNWAMVGVGAGIAFGGAVTSGLASRDIPQMAEGGIVTRPTLALVGERGPEAVVPLSKGGGRPIVINFNGHVWDRRAAMADVVNTLRSEFTSGY